MENTNPDFTKVVHTRENSKENEKHLNANRFHFTGQCAVVLSLLQAGHVLTVRSLMLQWNIGDGGRRIRELKEAKVPIIEDWVYDKDGKKTRYKSWAMYAKTDDSKKEIAYKKGQKNSSDYSKELINLTKPEQKKKRSTIPPAIQKDFDFE
jgi:hypothetical protein